jgi:hypothetical protein
VTVDLASEVRWSVLAFREVLFAGGLMLTVCAAVWLWGRAFGGRGR